MNKRIARARRRQAGFTLVELLVVIVILGILSAVVVFAVRGVGDKGEGAAVATDERTIRVAEESYCANNRRYANEAELVNERYLSDYSRYHDVTATTDPPDPRPCNGWRYVLTETRGSGSTITPQSTTTTTPFSPPTTQPFFDSWAPLGEGPSPRHSAAMAEFPPTQTVVMFGGVGPGVQGNDASTSYSVEQGDTWLWNGSWTLGAPSPAGCLQEPPQALTPCPRAAHSMAYDAARGKVVMVGGQLQYHMAGEQQNVRTRTMRETWTWDGSAWASAGPGPQSLRSAMAYDAARQKVVLFGGIADDGIGGNGPDTDATWIWDGANWSQAPAGPRPHARQGASMAYDSVTHRVILFGGWFHDPDNPNGQSTDTLLGDTWAWDGTSWAQLSPATSPPKRTLASMASNSTNRIVLFGGQDATPPSDDPVASQVPIGGAADTWIWDGATWTRRQPANSPPGNAYAPLAYHAATSQFVMFGGSTDVTASQTWAYATPTSPPTTLPPTTLPPTTLPPVTLPPVTIPGL